jgi:WD40 repeat protein
MSKSQEAIKNLQSARQSEKKAKDAQIEALKQRVIAEENLQKARISEMIALENARQIQIQKGIVEKEKNRALELKTLAEGLASKNQEIAMIAEREKEKAVNSEKIANELRTNTLAQSLALRSRQTSNIELKNALAILAIHYAKKVNLDLNDPILFEAVRDAYSAGHPEKSHFYPGFSTSVLVRRNGKVFGIASDGSEVSCSDKTSKPATNNKEKNKPTPKILSSDREGKILVFDHLDDHLQIKIALSEGTRTHSINKPDSLRKCIITRDKKQLVILSGSHKLHIYDLESLKNTKPSIFKLGGYVTALAEGNETGTYFYSYYLPKEKKSDKLVKVNLKRNERTDLGNILATALSVDSKFKFLLAGNQKGEIYLIDLLNKKNDLFQDYHHAQIEHLIWQDNDSGFITYGADRKILVFDKSKGFKKPILLNNHSERLNSIMLDERNVLYGSSESGNIWFWNLNEEFMLSAICEETNRGLTKEEWEENVGGENFMDNFIPCKQ